MTKVYAIYDREKGLSPLSHILCAPCPGSEAFTLYESIPAQGAALLRKLYNQLAQAGRLSPTEILMTADAAAEIVRTYAALAKAPAAPGMTVYAVRHREPVGANRAPLIVFNNEAAAVKFIGDPAKVTAHHMPVMITKYITYADAAAWQEETEREACRRAWGSRWSPPGMGLTLDKAA